MHGHEVRRLSRASSGAFGFAWRCPQLESSVRWERDGYGRVTKVDYGSGETETFSYDRWGRISERTRGDLSETYRYDHFGRLVERRDGNGMSYGYAYDAWGRRTSLRIRHPDGTETAERRAYDRFGRLSEISSFGSTVKYRYDAKGRVSRQTVDGTPIDFAYDRLGRLAGKWLGGRGSPDASVEYEYSPDGRIAARTANGVRQEFDYDARDRLTAVREGGAEVERYAYDRAGNMVRKTVRGRTTTYAFDGANQLVSSTSDGVTTKYAYDAAGRLVREGDRAYRYGYLDKVLSVTEGKRKLTYTYHVDGQLARADYGDGRAEGFAWDGLALVRRGGESFICEPHVGGGNPIASSEGTAYLNDMLGTTVAAKSGRRCSAAALTAFGEPLPVAGGGAFFTGKPQVEGLGYAFLYRNYRASLAKWQTADPLGYPDGWNQLAYCNNWATGCVDLMGAAAIDYNVKWTNFEFQNYYFASDNERIFGDMFDTDNIKLSDDIFDVIVDKVLPRVDAQIDDKVYGLVLGVSSSIGRARTRYGTVRSYGFGSVCWALGDGTVGTSSSITYSWWEESSGGWRFRHYAWSATVTINYSDVFEDPLDIGIEAPFSKAYSYYHTWNHNVLVGTGTITIGPVEIE